MNYTEDQTKHIIQAYQRNPNRDTVEMLAEELEKSVKSIIGKLSREGVYRREIYKAKSGELKWRSFQISLIHWELKWTLYWAWRKLQKPPLKHLKKQSEV